MKRKILCIVVLLWVLVILSGCGGGVEGITPSPSTFPVNAAISPSQIYEGEKCDIFLSLPSNVGEVVNVVVSQEPQSPSGVFLQITPLHWEWRAPQVNNQTIFTLIVGVKTTKGEGRGEGQITVLKKGQPPSNPPYLELIYPNSSTPEDCRIVGNDTLLTILLRVFQGDNPLQKIQVKDYDGTLLQEFPISSGGFCRIDLSHFGVPGTKNIKIRVVDKAGLSDERVIEIINNDDLLRERSLDFLKKYNSPIGACRYGDLNDGPYACPVRIGVPDSLMGYKNEIEKAAEFWTRYTGIQFQLIPTPVYTYPGIAVLDYRDVDPGIIAGTRRGFSSPDVAPWKLDAETITLYKKWFELGAADRIGALVHELWHCLLSFNECTELSGYFVGWPYVNSVEIQVIPPLVQKATKILYSKQPGEPW